MPTLQPRLQPRARLPRTEDEMTGSKYLFVVALLIVNMFLAESATQNAMEAHRHTHELACHVGATELCDYHEGESHD